MRNITAKEIEKAFGGKIVLSDVNFTLAQGDKLALVGENGSGKSTLLKIITGNLDYDGGKLIGTDSKCVYVAQDFSGKDEETPYDFLSRRVKKMHRAVKLLDQAGFNAGKDGEKLKSIYCKNLSGGEKKKLELVAGLASGAPFIAMDEPENHLDYHTISWLIENLSKFRGGLIFVSHNQYFINILSNSILELADGEITVYSMRYEEYLEEKERQVNGQARKWTIEEKTIRRLRNTVEDMKGRAKAGILNPATYRQTKRRFNQLKEQHKKKPTTDPKTKPKLNLSDVKKKQGKLIVSIENMNFSYGDNKVFIDANAELRFGEKVVLFGPNGSGKSTLINLLLGKIASQSGTVKMGNDVRWALMTQDHLEGINEDDSALKVFQEKVRWSEQKSRAYLARYGITTSLVKKPLKKISGGQQARFKLALMFSQDPEFLILDEPTNHVDPSTWDAITAAIKDYSGTVLAVTHDRMFIDAIAEKMWVIDEKKIFIELGNFSDCFLS